jgi:transcriptional regulator with XRE-family HTH domain
MTWGTSTRTVPNQSNGLALKHRLAGILAAIPAKVLARAAGTTEKAAAKWKAGDNAPNAEALLRLAAEFDCVWAIVRQQSCRDITDAERMLDQVADLLKRRRE